MLSATFGLLFIAYQSTNVSIEIANTKIELSSALSKTREIKSDLEEENERLREASAFLEDKVRELLDIPDPWRVVALTPLGYPAKETKPRSRKEISEITSLNKWGKAHPDME